MYLCPLLGSIFLTASFKHNDCIITMKQELLQCFLSRYVLTNRVSLYGTNVMTEKNPKIKRVLVSFHRPYEPVLNTLVMLFPSGWPNQSTVRGCKLCCQSARAFLSLWKHKGIHTSNHTHFEITGFASQATFHNSTKQNWGRPSPHPSRHPKTKLPSQCLAWDIKLN